MNITTLFLSLNYSNFSQNCGFNFNGRRFGGPWAAEDGAAWGTRGEAAECVAIQGLAEAQATPAAAVAEEAACMVEGFLYECDAGVCEL